MWQYKIVPIPPNAGISNVEDGLNGLGLDGWELVQHYINASARIFVFKRPVGASKQQNAPARILTRQKKKKK